MSDINGGEIWKQIPGFVNYEASTFGRIKRSVGGKGTRAGKIRIPFGKGPLQIDLWENGVCFRLYVHHAVAFTFIGPRPTPLHEIAHWDGKNINNAPTNLRWATHKENEQDKIRHGTIPFGSKHKKSKLTEQDVLLIREKRASGSTLSALGYEFNVELTNIDFICRGVAWRHVGGPITSRTMYKLKDEDVREIHLLIQQKLKFADIAAKYSVSFGTISHIATGRSWKHVQ